MKRQAIFMIFLTVMIPIYSAHSLAYVNIDVYGTDGIKNTIKDRDTLNIVVTTDQPVKDLNPYYMRYVLGSASKPFKSCSKSGNSTVCRFEETRAFSEGRFDFDIEVRNDARILEGKSSYFVVDRKPPTIAISAVRDSKATLELDYFAEDPSPCTALSYLEVYVDNIKKSQISLNGTGCFASGTIPLSKSSLGDGRKTVCIYARDLVSQSSNPSCQQLIIDTQPPQVRTAFLKDFFDTEIRYFSKVEKSFLFTVNISDLIGFSKGEVYADLSGLNPAAGYGNERLSCRNVAEKDWLCEREVRFSIDATRSVSVRINATDDSGYSAISTKSLSLNYVDASPFVDKIYTNHVNQLTDESFLGRENRIFARVASQAQINNVYAEISYPGSPVSQAEMSCVGTTSKECYLDHTVSGNPSSVEVRVFGTDVIGTHFTQKKSLKVDLLAPKYIRTYALSANRDYLVNGDNIEVIVNLSDSISSIDGNKVKVRFPFISNQERAAQCTHYMTYSECRVPLSSIPSGDFSAQGEFYDVAGNMNTFASANATLLYHDGAGWRSAPDYTRIYEQLLVPSGNIWTITTESVSPSKIDRQIASLGVEGLGLILYAVLKYSGASGSPSQKEIFSSAVTSCDSPYIEMDEASLIDGGTDTKVLALPLYLISLKNTSSLNITCNISTVSLINGKDLTTAELDNVSVNVPIYATAFGELDSNIEKKIAEVAHNVNNTFFKTIGKIQKLIDSSQELCSIITLLVNVDIVIAGITDLLKVGTVTQAAGKATGFAQKAVDTATFGIYPIAKKYCLIISCRLGILDAAGVSQGEAASKWMQACGMGKDPPDKSTVTGDTASSELFFDWLMSSNAGIKSSIVLSTACLCIPGIIYNLNKYRQIDCMYLQCLKQTAYGTPKYICDQTRDYMVCKYVVGEIFNLIPFGIIAETIAALLKKMMTNIGTLITVGISAACQFHWFGLEPTHSTCAFAKWGEALYSVMCDLGTMSDCTPLWRQDLTTEDVCDQVLGK